MHRDTDQVFGLIVDSAPLAGLFVDDEEPPGGIGQRVKGIAASWDLGRPDPEIALGDEGSRFISSGAPDFIEWNQATEDLAATHGGRTIVNGNVFAVE